MRQCKMRPGNLVDYRGYDSNVENAKQRLNDDKEVFWLLSYSFNEVFKKHYPERGIGDFRNPDFLIALLLDEGVINRKEAELMKKNCDRWVSYWATR